MRAKRYSLASVAAVCLLVLAVVPFALADLVVTSLGNRGDGKTLVRFSYSGSGGNTGTWTVPAGVTSVELLIVGGGGGGSNSGNDNGANGAGGGGVNYTSSYSVSGVLNVEVGKGGAGAASNGAGSDGGTSKFNNVWATGGQGGTINPAAAGAASGGYSLDGGTTILGVVAGSASGAPKGGSGAGQVGFAGFSGGVCDGGNGLTSTIVSENFASANSLPYDGGYYGGGGGGCYSGSGGSGGGGDGHFNEGTRAEAGVDGLGGGGGSSEVLTAGDGGDGVIYVAYTTPSSGTVISIR